MFILSLFSGVGAFNFEGHIPTIMIAQRTITTPAGHHMVGAIDPLFFERLFRERGMPIVSKSGVDRKPTYGEKETLYRSRRGIEDRVNDNYDGARDYDGSVYRTPHRAVEDAEERAAGKSRASGSRMHAIVRVVLVILAVVVSGLAGYHFGKVAESRNYVRVPSIN